MSNETLFRHSQNGPYQQYAAIGVRDGGNGLPVHLYLATGDPEQSCDNSMSISMAKLYHRELGKAIEAAEEAGIKDAGF
jgi:hypothetical protein